MRHVSGSTALGLLLVALVAVLPSCGGGRARTTETLPPREMTLSEKVRMADSYRSAGRMNDALELLQETVAAHPEDARLHRVYGEYLFLAGRFGDAERELERALEIDPYLTDARNWLGVALTEQGRYDEGEAQFLRALEDPAYPSPQLIYFNLGMLHRKQGLDTEGIEQLRKAVQVDPRYHQAHFELALALEAVGQVDEALDEMVVAEPAFRQDGEYWYRRGFLEFRSNRTNRALESLRRCVDVSPGSPAAAKARELMEVIAG